jgi:hypothetical protein
VIGQRKAARSTASRKCLARREVSSS